MTDQLTPSELREAAKRLRYFAEMGTGTAPFRSDAIAGAVAARRLADVIEYAEAETHREGARWAGRRTFARDVLKRVRGHFHIARGETTSAVEPRHFAPYGSTNALCDETVPRRVAWDFQAGEYADLRFTVKRDRTTCADCRWRMGLGPARGESTSNEDRRER